MQIIQHTNAFRRATLASLHVAALTSLLLALSATAAAQRPQKTAAHDTAPALPVETLVRVVRAEDERRWEASDLGALLSDKSAAVRRRAALAAGRIGDEGAVAPLAGLLRRDTNEGVRVTAAFALGEIESNAGADVLTETLRLSKSAAVRARGRGAGENRGGASRGAGGTEARARRSHPRRARN